MKGESINPHFLRAHKSPPRLAEVQCQTDLVEEEYVKNVSKMVQSLDLDNDLKTDVRATNVHDKVSADSGHGSSYFLSKVPHITPSIQKSGEISLSAFYQTRPTNKAPKVAQTLASQDPLTAATKINKPFYAGKVSYNTVEKKQPLLKTGTQVVTFAPQMKLDSGCECVALVSA